jgi:hypothetical protein
MKRRLTLTGSTIVPGLALAVSLCVLLHIGSGRALSRVLAGNRPLRVQAPGDVYCVDHEDGTHPGCLLVFATIQDAVDAAAGGETIRASTRA